ncbi:MAG: HAD family phosphatase [Anaerolineaceae bacterium]|nr:HAD family phosphatase [Anaerolineaceae bacterium]
MAENGRRGVALDMDGVVIDGMQFHVRSWQHSFREVAGVEVPPLEIYLREGFKEDYFISKIAGVMGISLTTEQQTELHRCKLAYFDEIFCLDPVPGIQESLKLMREQGYALALVTGAARAVAERALSEMGVRHWFDAVSGSDEVRHGKPAAEPYQKGAAALGVTPEACLVVENAPPGIQSAKAAGMVCVALETSLDASYLQEADRVINTHAELQDLLRAEYAISGGRGEWRLP